MQLSDAQRSDAQRSTASARQVAAWFADRHTPDRHTPGGRACPRATRVLAVDGPSGAGKTTIARAVAGQLGAALVSMDDLYDGWDGLAAGIDQLVDAILRPLAAGQPACWRRYDWPAGRYGDTATLAPAGVAVIEGVGAGARAAGPLLGGLVFVTAPLAQRRGRALARDGDLYAAHWERWARQEARYFARDDIAGRADLLVNGAPTGDDHRN